MKPVGNQDPQRPYLTQNERENRRMGDDKDHINNEPVSDDLATTGDGPLNEDDSLEQDQADCPER